MQCSLLDDTIIDRGTKIIILLDGAHEYNHHFQIHPLLSVYFIINNCKDPYWRTQAADGLFFLTDRMNLRSSTRLSRVFLGLMKMSLQNKYRVSLKKRSFVIPAPLEALGCSKGLDVSQKHCQSSFFG